MTAAKHIAAFIARLAGSEPDNAAVVEAIHVVAAGVRRKRRDDQDHVIVAERDGRLLRVFSSLSHAHHAADLDRTLLRTDGILPGEPPALLNAEGAIVVEADGGFTWSWAEISEGLRTALEAIPQSRRPKEHLCPECSRRFLR